MLLEAVMAIDRSALTPQQRLAISRRALFNEFDYESGSAETDSDPSYQTSEKTLPESTSTARFRKTGLLAGFPMLSVAKNIGERWWRRHPANAVVQLGRPVLARYARRQPAKLMAYAAGTGALLVILRPWRLLSVTALAAAVFKTSDVADMVTTLMHSNNRIDLEDD
jgi:hypothetical protein